MVDWQKLTVKEAAAKLAEAATRAEEKQAATSTPPSTLAGVLGAMLTSAPARGALVGGGLGLGAGLIHKAVANPEDRKKVSLLPYLGGGAVLGSSVPGLARLASGKFEVPQIREALGTPAYNTIQAVSSAMPGGVAGLGVGLLRKAVASPEERKRISLLQHMGIGAGVSGVSPMLIRAAGLSRNLPQITQKQAVGPMSTPAIKPLATASMPAMSAPAPFKPMSPAEMKAPAAPLTPYVPPAPTMSATMGGKTINRTGNAPGTPPVAPPVAAKPAVPGMSAPVGGQTMSSLAALRPAAVAPAPAPRPAAVTPAPAMPRETFNYGSGSTGKPVSLAKPAYGAMAKQGGIDWSALGKTVSDTWSGLPGPAQGALIGSGVGLGAGLLHKAVSDPKDRKRLSLLPYLAGGAAIGGLGKGLYDYATSDQNAVGRGLETGKEKLQGLADAKHDWRSSDTWNIIGEPIASNMAALKGKVGLGISAALEGRYVKRLLDAARLARDPGKNLNYWRGLLRPNVPFSNVIDRIPLLDPKVRTELLNSWKIRPGVLDDYKAMNPTARELYGTIIGGPGKVLRRPFSGFSRPFKAIGNAMRTGDVKQLIPESLSALNPWSKSYKSYVTSAPKFDATPGRIGSPITRLAESAGLDPNRVRANLTQVVRPDKALAGATQARLLDQMAGNASKDWGRVAANPEGFAAELKAMAAKATKAQPGAAVLAREASLARRLFGGWKLFGHGAAALAPQALGMLGEYIMPTQSASQAQATWDQYMRYAPPGAAQGAWNANPSLQQYAPRPELAPTPAPAPSNDPNNYLAPFKQP